MNLNIKLFISLFFLLSLYGHGVGLVFNKKAKKYKYEVGCVRQQRKGGELQEGCENLLQERKNSQDRFRDRRRKLAGESDS
jgi:hypothetical protein